MTYSPTQLQQYLGGLDYPVYKETLIQKAEEHGAGDDVVQTLRDMPFDRFDSPNQVSDAFGAR
jgi:hypothetical protein